MAAAQTKYMPRNTSNSHLTWRPSDWPSVSNFPDDLFTRRQVVANREDVTAALWIGCIALVFSIVALIFALSAYFR